MKTLLSSGRDQAIDADDVVFDYRRDDRSRAAVRGAFWSALNSLIPTMLNGLVFVVTSRYLLPADFGLVSLAFAIVVFAAGIGPTAFGEALIQQKVIRRSHLDTVFWLAFGSAALLYGVLIALSPLIARLVGQERLIGLLLILGPKILFDMVAIVPNALISRTMMFHLATVRTAVSMTVSSLLCLALILSGFGLWALAAAQIGASAAACVAAFWGAGWLPGMRIRRASLHELARYGVFASGNRFLQSMNLDQLVIGTLISPAALGIYNFARRLFQMMNDVVAGGLTSVTHVLLSSLQDEEARMREAFLMATFGCSLVAFPAFIGLAAVAGDAVPLIFGPHWIPAIWPLRFFCVIGLMSGIGVIQASLINSQGKSDWWFYYQLVRNVVTIVTIVLLRHQGVGAIVLALMVEVLLLWPVTLGMVSRLITLSVPRYFGQFLRPAAAAAAMLVAVAGVGALLEQAPVPLRLAAEVASGGVAYGLLTVALSGRQVALLARTIISNRRGRSPLAQEPGVA